MKKLKHVKTFESFKLNEEVPFNQDEFKRNFNQEEWTEKERSDLHKLGADEMGKSSAIFRQKRFDVTVSKVPGRTQRVCYYAVNSMWDDCLEGDYRWVYPFNGEFSSYKWDDFLTSLSEHINLAEEELEKEYDENSDDKNTRKNYKNYIDLNPSNPKTGEDRYGDTNRFDNLRGYNKRDVEKWKKDVDNYREYPTLMAPMENPVKRKSWWD